MFVFPVDPFDFSMSAFQRFSLSAFDLAGCLMSKRDPNGFLKMEWILRAIEHPVHTKVQSDGRIRKWTKIDEAGKYLRVVLLPDGETVPNAFFDRDFSGT